MPSLRREIFYSRGLVQPAMNPYRRLEKRGMSTGAYCNQNGTTVPQFEAALSEFDISEREIVLGQGYRDGEPLGR
jgi:hypothetical protein